MITKALILTMLLVGVPLSMTHSETLISCTTTSDTPPQPKPGTR